jgi:hypothetical protein
MVEQVHINQMIAMCESYLKDVKGYQGKIVFNQQIVHPIQRQQLKVQFQLLNELYSVAKKHYEDKNKSAK